MHIFLYFSLSCPLLTNPFHIPKLSCKNMLRTRSVEMCTIFAISRTSTFLDVEHNLVCVFWRNSLFWTPRANSYIYVCLCGWISSLHATVVFFYGAVPGYLFSTQSWGWVVLFVSSFFSSGISCLGCDLPIFIYTIIYTVLCIHPHQQNFKYVLGDDSFLQPFVANVIQSQNYPGIPAKVIFYYSGPLWLYA